MLRSLIRKHVAGKQFKALNVRDGHGYDIIKGEGDSESQASAAYRSCRTKVKNLSSYCMELRVLVRPQQLVCNSSRYVCANHYMSDRNQRRSQNQKANHCYQSPAVNVRKSAKVDLLEHVIQSPGRFLPDFVGLALQGVHEFAAFDRINSREDIDIAIQTVWSSS